MTTINPWINFNGNAEEAFTFYKSVFGGEFSKVMRAKDGKKIALIALPIGKNTALMANDVPEVLGRVNENENRSKIAVQTETKEEAGRLFNGLSAGGAVECAMENGPFESYMGMFRDKYGIEWIIEFSADSKH
jgi:PhnB protein